MYIHVHDVVVVSSYVCAVMGGPIENVSAFHYELSIGEVQHDMKSNLIPLGAVKKGVHRHRALLFKVCVCGDATSAYREFSLIRCRSFSKNIIWLINWPFISTYILVMGNCGG